LNQNNFRKSFLILITGLLVIGIPVIFINFLSDRIMERSRESALELLREKLLLEMESFKSRLKPQNYVKHLIRKAHRKLLPEITTDILRLYPSRNFGRDQFNEALPEKFAGELKSLGVSPLLFNCNSVQFENLYYWYDHRLHQQLGKDSRKLALALSNANLGLAASMYRQNYLKEWNLKNSSNPQLHEIMYIFTERDYLINTYISRFIDLHHQFDQVRRIYSDYFSKQYLYTYNYCCLSSVNIHGCYNVIVTQNSIDPIKLADYAQTNSSAAEVTTSLIKNAKATQNGFKTDSDQISFVSPLPKEFFAHLIHWNKVFPASASLFPKDIKLLATAPISAEISDLIELSRFVKLFSKILLMLYMLLFFRTWFFGLDLPLKIHIKLAAVLGIIVLLPVSATAIFSYYLLSGYERVVESHLVARVNNKLDVFTRFESENRLRLQVKSLKIKQWLQNHGDQHPIATKIQNIEKTFPDLYNWVTAVSFYTPQGEFFDLHGTARRDSTLLEGLLAKYVINQGLLNAGGRKAQELEIKANVTMGLLENFLTPEIEEAAVPNEGTLQREIVHTLDTNLAIFLIVPVHSGESILGFLRTNNIELDSNKYLVAINLKNPQFFDESSGLVDIKSSARLRRHSTYTHFTWPPRAIFDKNLAEIFDQAMNQRENGIRVVRSKSGLEIKGWRFRENHQGVFVAYGKARKLNDIGQAIFMIFPFILGYSIIVLTVISRALSNQFLRPIDFLTQGIKAINSDQLGVTIQKTQINEFSKINQAFNEMSVALKQKQLISRYVSDRLIENIAKLENQEQSSSETIEVSIISSDIRGFTSITETHPPFEVVDMLNSYFTAMEDVILKENGVIDKYVGDAIVAIFYSGPELSAPAVRACNSALAMRDALKNFNKKRRENDEFTIENGIGIATGKVISGSIGSETGRKTFTVTGKATEIAAELEAQTSSTSSKILVCPVTEQKSRNFFEFADFLPDKYELKGRKP
jgi:class 3 adenylate cyclase